MSIAPLLLSVGASVYVSVMGVERRLREEGRGWAEEGSMKEEERRGRSSRRREKRRVGLMVDICEINIHRKSFINNSYFLCISYGC